METLYPTYFGHEQLEVYHLALGFVSEVYRLSETFPKSEQFGLTNQLRRAATSVALNIAEGKGRGSDWDFAKFLYQSRGSLLESVSALQISVKLGFAGLDQIEALLAEAGRINAKLNALINSLDTGV